MLSEFYKAHNLPEKEQIRLEKNILFIMPDKDYDLKPVLVRLGLSKWEVAVTYPKNGLDMFSEVMSAQPKLIIQVGKAVTRKFPFLPDDGSMDAALKAKAESVIADGYASLHHHDEFSIKDGLGTVDQLIRMLKAQRRSFCCVTNHGSVGGWIKQYNACKKNGVKAIFGMEAYVSPYRGDDPEEKKKHRSASHLVLIAKTMEGFDNIIKIHNDAQMNGFYYTPRADHAAFKQWGKGIIASTACMAGEFPRMLMAGEKDKAKELYEHYKGCFDEFYIEIQIIEYEAQREANRRLIEFAKEVGAPLVLTCDSHYLEPEHADTHDILMCIRQHKTLFDSKGEENEDLWNFDVKNMYCRTAEQMRQVFENGFVDKNGTSYAPFKDEVFTEEVFQEAIANTRKIALSTEDIKLDSAIKLPRLYDDSAKILRKKINDGFKYRMLDNKRNVQEYIDRLAFEFDVITKLGWGDYFLVMEKIVSDAISEFGEWAIGYGRGSAAGSLVSYCLRLTDVDPLQYGLLFERFLDASRPTPPDIDTDFDPRIREWVKDHIVDTFGKDHVCSIGTYQTYRTRAVILDVARALNEDLALANEVTKKIDPLDSFEDEDGEEKKVDKLTFDELCGHYPELKAYFDTYPAVRHHAEILRNQVKNMGTHAGGVIISDINLQGRIPILYDKASSEDRKIISAWAEAGGNEELSAVGLVKFDILGLNNLPVISDCVQLIQQNKGIEIKRWEIPIDDSKTIRLASKKDLVGIFQLDNPSTKPVADAVEMESLEDVAAVTSLIRPGPRDMGMDLEYAERKHGKPYAMPNVMRSILADTHGVITYQEQCMKVAQVLAGFTPTESYKFLKAIAKKQKDLMESFKQKFKDGAQKRVDAGELTGEDVENIWSLLETFAGYGFNKSVDIHSLVWCNGVQKEIGEVVSGDRVLCFDGVRMVQTEVVALHDHGVLPAFEVVFEGGGKVVCSINHKFETESGKMPLWKMLLEKVKVFCAEEVEQLGVHGLSGYVSDEESIGIPSKGRRAFVQGATKSVDLQRMRNKDIWDTQMAESSGEVSCGKRDCKEQPCHCQSQESSIADGDTTFHGHKGEVVCFCSGINNVRQEGTEEKVIADVGNDETTGLSGKDERCVFSHSGRDIQEEGLVGQPFCKSAKMARKESREVGSQLKEGQRCKEGFQSRRMDMDGSVTPRNVSTTSANKMWGEVEGSGFCKPFGVDRSGWLLAFWKRFRSSSLPIIQGTRTRCDAKSGSRKKGNNPDSLGAGLLEGKRETQIEERMDGFSEGNDTKPEAGSVSLRRMLSARFVGFRRMCDLEVFHPAHNFALASGIVTSNSHAITYSALSTAELWLKYNYPTEYITSLINNSKLGKKKHGEDVFVGYVNYARRSGVEVLPPDVSMSLTQFAIWDGKILFSLEHIKNVASMAEVITKFQPFASIEDFHERVKVEGVSAKGKATSRRPNKRVVETLIEAGAFDKFGPDGAVDVKRNAIVAEYYRVRGDKKEQPPQHTKDEWVTLEKEALGLCLSQPPLFRQYEDLIRQKGWKLICELEDRKRVHVFGMVEAITPRTSKTGNPMYMVEISDGLDRLTFFVFKGAQQFFKDHFKIGTIAAIPLSKFDEGDMRFYDERKDCEIVRKPIAAPLPVAVMPNTRRKIKDFTDGYLEFDKGSIDDWCVYLNRNGMRHSPKDVEYFQSLVAFGSAYGNDAIYQEFVTVFDMTAKDIDPKVLAHITETSQKYGKDALEMDILLTTLYATMIAEQNKENSILGKRIKRLGVHQVLVEDTPVADAAAYSTKKSHKWITKECSSRSF